jgi:DNA-binding beta-propeller fold protein YncE
METTTTVNDSATRAKCAVVPWHHAGAAARPHWIAPVFNFASDANLDFWLGATVQLQVSCKSDLIVTPALPDLPKQFGVGGCPVDIDVDFAAQRAYTANAEAPPRQGISVFDVSDPLNPVFKGHIDSGGANPTRLKILRGGQIVAATKDGVFTGNEGASSLSKSDVVDPPLDMFADLNGGTEGRGFVAVVTKTGQVAVFMPNGSRVIPLNGDALSAAQAGRKIYVVNHGSNNVSVIDVMSTKDPPKVIPLDDDAAPIDLAARPELPAGQGELFVTESGRGRIAVIDTNADKFETSFGADLKAPTFIAFAPKGCVAVAYDSHEGAFARIDSAQREVYGQVQKLVDGDPALKRIVGVTIDPDFWAYVTLDDGTRTKAFHALCRS